uniref:Kinesin motor domain-containing protein n=1 Tax=Dendroctonus ponderosae TaxID=77166 RepID=A0AAR5Q252_DENPD
MIKENTSLKMENLSLKSKCAMFTQLQEENSNLQNSILKCESELKACLEEKNDILPKYEEALKVIENTRNELSASQLSIANLKDTLIKYQLERHKMHNLIQDLKGNIRVFCRVRPVLMDDGEKPLCRISFPDDHSLEISKQLSGELEDSKSEYSFDKVFSQDSTQTEVFEELSHLVQS